MVSRQQVIGIIGALIVFLGMFLPLVTISIRSGGFTLYDSVNWIESGAGFAALLIILIIASVVLLFTEYRKFASLTGVLTAITVIVRLIYTLQDAANFAQLERMFGQPGGMTDPGGMVYGDFIGMSVNPIGWVILLLGSIVIVYSGLRSERKSEN